MLHFRCPHKKNLAFLPYQVCQIRGSHGEPCKALVEITPKLNYECHPELIPKTPKQKRIEARKEAKKRKEG